MGKAQINFLAVQSLTVFVVSNKIATSQILYDARRSGRPNIDTISVFFFSKLVKMKTVLSVQLLCGLILCQSPKLA